MSEKIILSKSVNVVEITDKHHILKRNHIITLRLQGFKEIPTSSSYRCNLDNSAGASSIYKYLQNLGYEIEPDSSMVDELEEFEYVENDYQRSVQIGLQTKKQKTLSIIKPPNFNPKIKIKPYQFKSIRHMIDVTHAANFSVPGSGKTLMTYATYDILKQKGIVDSMLVIGPTSSFSPWEQEYQFCLNRSFKNNVLRYHGPSRKSNLRALRKYDIILTTYNAATSDLIQLKTWLMTDKKVMMVIDESHHVKSIDDDASHATAMISLGKFAKRRYILSGTPVPHSYKDLWSQITFLWPTIQILFTRERYKTILENYNGINEISNRISFLWTRVTNNHLKKDMPRILPEKIIQVAMSPLQEKIYTAIEQDIWRTEQSNTSIDLFQFRKNRILRLLQSVTNPGILTFGDSAFGLEKFKSDDPNLNADMEIYSEISPKITKAAKLALEITKKGANVVVWTIFIKNVEMLCREIERLAPGSNPIGISGNIPIESNLQRNIVGREELIDEFKNSTNRILVATMGSIAESISLHKTCQRAIYLERGFNAGQYMQSLSRIYRIGSDKKKPIQFIFLQSIFSDKTTETIDNRIDMVLKERIKQMHKLLNDEFKIHRLQLSIDNYVSAEDSEENEETLFHDSMNNMIREHKEKGII